MRLRQSVAMLPCQSSQYLDYPQHLDIKFCAGLEAFEKSPVSHDVVPQHFLQEGPSNTCSRKRKECVRLQQERISRNAVLDLSLPRE